MAKHSRQSEPAISPACSVEVVRVRRKPIRTRMFVALGDRGPERVTCRSRLLLNVGQWDCGVEGAGAWLILSGNLSQEELGFGKAESCTAPRLCI